MWVLEEQMHILKRRNIKSKSKLQKMLSIYLNLRLKPINCGITSRAREEWYQKQGQRRVVSQAGQEKSGITSRAREKFDS